MHKLFAGAIACIVMTAPALVLVVPAEAGSARAVAELHRGQQAPAARRRPGQPLVTRRLVRRSRTSAATLRSTTRRSAPTAGLDRDKDGIACEKPVSGPTLDSVPGLLPGRARSPFWSRTKVGVVAGVAGLLIGLAGTTGSDAEVPPEVSSATEIADLQTELDETLAANDQLSDELTSDRAEAATAASDASRVAKRAQKKAVRAAIARTRRAEQKKAAAAVATAKREAAAASAPTTAVAPLGGASQLDRSAVLVLLRGQRRRLRTVLPGPGPRVRLVRRCRRRRSGLRVLMALQQLQDGPWDPCLHLVLRAAHPRRTARRTSARGRGTARRVHRGRAVHPVLRARSFRVLALRQDIDDWHDSSSGGEGPPCGRRRPRRGRSWRRSIGSSSLRSKIPARWKPNLSRCSACSSARPSGDTSEASVDSIAPLGRRLDGERGRTPRTRLFACSLRGSRTAIFGRKPRTGTACTRRW